MTKLFHWAGALALAVFPSIALAQAPIGKPVVAQMGYVPGVGIYCDDGTGHAALCGLAATGPKPSANSISVAPASDALFNTQQPDNVVVPTVASTAAGTVVFTADTSGYKGVLFQISGTWGGSFAFSGSNDGVNFVSVNAIYIGGPQVAAYYAGAYATNTANGLWYSSALMRYFRLTANNTTGTLSTTALLKQTSVDPVTPTITLSTSTLAIGNVYRAVYASIPIVAPPAANASVNTATQDAAGSGNTTTFNMARCFARGDQPGTLNALASTDNFVSSNFVEYTQATQANVPTYLQLPNFFRYHRCQFTAGATPPSSTGFVLSSQIGE